MRDFTIYASDPVGFAREVLGFEPTEAQKKVLDFHARKGILCCSRGFGKTQITAVLAAWQFAVHGRSLILVVSETAEKAAELVERVAALLALAGIPFDRDRLRRHGLRHANGSRILPIPARSGAVRGYPATMILVDEAALVPDRVWTALLGTRATTFANCRVWLMSTPGPMSGFFYELWMSKDPAWIRIKVTAAECPWIAPEYLAEMRRIMSEPDFNREFMAEWSDSKALLIATEDQQKAITESESVLDMTEEYRSRAALMPARPLGERVLLATDEWTDRNGFIIAADLGQSRDHTAIAVLEYRLDPLGWHDPISLAPAFTARYVLRWLERFPLHTSYGDLAAIFGDFTTHPALAGRVTLAVDAGGVGRAFLDQLRSMRLGASLIPVQFTGGLHVTHERGFMNVPKREIALALEQLFRDGRIRIPALLPSLRELLAELATFERRRSVTGRMSFSGKTPSGGTDDLVMAFALAGWVATRKLRTAGGPDHEYHRWRSTIKR